MDTMVLTAGQREKDVRDLKREISDLVRLIQRLNGDLEALQRKVGIAQINTLPEFVCPAADVVRLFC